MDQGQKHPIGRILIAYAAKAMPDDLDLWPAIAKQLQSHQGELRPARRIRMMALMLAAAAFLVALLVMIGFPLGSRHMRSASAADMLFALARVAAEQPLDLSGTENGYRYIKSEGTNLTSLASPGGNSQSFSVLVPRTRELWVAPDGSGRIREAAGNPVFLGERDRANWQAAGSPPLGQAINRDFGPGGLTYEDFTQLPPDPEALAAVIRRRATIPSGPPVDIEMFIVVGDILREPGVPPELRAALYKVAAKINGVELIGNVADRSGRPAVAVAMTTSYWGAKQRLTLIFDPITSALLSEEKVLLERAGWVDATPPVVIGYSTYLESGIMTRLP